MTKINKSQSYSFGSCFEYTINYFHETTFHGLRQIVTPKRHWLEVFLWSVIVVSASSIAGWIMYRNYVRYQANPVVISVHKNFRTWNITFPASTLCFVDKFNKEKGAALIKRKWGLLKDDKDFPYYMKFLEAVANSSYYSFGAFAEFANDSELNKENLTHLMDQVSFELGNEYQLTTFDWKRRSVYYNKTMLEMGICFSVNSLITLDLVPDTSVIPMVNESEKWHAMYCPYVDFRCYGVTQFLQRALYYYVHSPYEIPEVNSKAYVVQSGKERTTTFNHLDILSSSRIRDLKPDQRHCYFYDESRYNNLRYYSFNLCKIQCRRELAMKFCKCVPHFYIKQDDQPQCTIKQLQCIDKHKDELIHLTEIKGDRSVKICNNCYQACDEVNYYEENNYYEQAYGRITTYHWRIDNFSKIRYKREIIFGIEDLVISLGGIATFFLGCSLMSGVELIYFFSLRLIRYCRWKPKSNQKSEQAKRNIENLPMYFLHPSTKTYSNRWDMTKQHSIKIARRRRLAFVSYY